MNASPLLTVSLVCVLTLTACAEQDANALLQKGQQYRSQKEYKAAIIEFKNALQQNPGLVEARYALGLSYLATGDGKSAEKEFRKARQAGFKNRELDIALARALMAQGMWAEILTELQPPISSAAAPIKAEIHTLRGHAQLSLGRVDPARAEYASALAAAPGNPGAIIGVARADLLENNVDRAYQAADAVVKVAPLSADAWVLKGDVARVRKENAVAANAYSKALEIEPGNVLAKLNLVSVELQQQQLPAAQKHIDELRSILPNNAIVILQQGILEFQKGQYKKALALAQGISQAMPDYTPSRLLMGAAHFALGSYEQAEQALIRVLTATPNNAYAHKLLVASLLKQNKTRVALKWLNPALEAHPEDAQLLAFTGEAYFQLGEKAKAAEFMQAAVRQNPQSANLRTDLGLIKLANGDMAGAITTLQQASQLEPSNAKARAVLVATLLKDGKTDAALAELAGLEQRAPQEPELYTLRGRAYLAKGDRQQARGSFEKALAINPTYIPAVGPLASLDVEAKNIPGAVKRFESIIAIDKNNIAAMIQLAQFAVAAGDTANAISWLERARSVTPPAVEPRLILARLYLETQQGPKALALVNEVQNLSPRHPDLPDALGRAQLATGNTAAAYATFSQMSQAFPDSALAHYRLATVHMTKGDAPSAIDAFAKSVALQPQFLDAQSGLVSAYLANNDIEKAMANARTIREKYPKLPIGYIREGDVLMQQKKVAEALDKYKQAFAIAPNSRTLEKIVEARVRTGDGAAATRDLTQWLKAHPDDTASRKLLAGIFLSAGQFRLAAEQYELIQKIQPNQIYVLNNLAWSYSELGDPRGLEYAERANRLQPDNPLIMDTLGWLRIKQNKHGQALPLLEKAVKQAPDLPEIRYHLAVALSKSGEKWRAKRELETALASGKPFSQAAEAKKLLEQL